MSRPEKPVLSLVTRTARLAATVAALLVLGACGDDASPDPVDRQDGGSRPGTAPLDDSSDSSDAGTQLPAPDATSDDSPSDDGTTEPELITYAGGEAVPRSSRAAPRSDS